MTIPQTLVVNHGHFRGHGGTGSCVLFGDVGLLEQVEKVKREKIRRLLQSVPGLTEEDLKM
jgi:hypothetical protein